MPGVAGNFRRESGAIEKMDNPMRGAIKTFEKSEKLVGL
jgi:hypothetical protein